MVACATMIVVAVSALGSLWCAATTAIPYSGSIAALPRWNSASAKASTSSGLQVSSTDQPLA